MNSPVTARSTTVEAARASRFSAGLGIAWGVLLLSRPRQVLALAGTDPVPALAVTVTRVLGARHLTQSAVLASRPDPLVRTASVLTDGLHAASMLALAAAAPRYRGAALLSAAVATGLAALLRRPGSRPPAA